MKWWRLLLVRSGSYRQYDGKKLNETELLTKMSDGNLLISHLLEHNINFCFSDKGFSSKIIAEKLYKANKLDLLIHGNISVLLSMIDGRTYLDFILDGIKDKSIRHNLNEISIDGCTVAELAEFYLLIARRGMMLYIGKLSKKQLLNEYNGRTLLEELLNRDAIVTERDVILSSAKLEMEIAAMLESRGLIQESVDVPLENKDFTADYLVSSQNKHGIGPLPNEAEYLLNELYKSFADDGQSWTSLIDALISGYRQALFVNYDLAIQELKHLISIKWKNYKKFTYLKSDETCFMLPTGTVESSQIEINSVLHETGHALHLYLNGMKTPDEYEELKERLRNDPSVLRMVDEFIKLCDEKYDEVNSFIKDNYKDILERQISFQNKDEFDEILAKIKIDKKRQLKCLGIDEAKIEEILNKVLSSEEYIRQVNRMYVRKFTIDMFRSKYGYLASIVDILDAIYDGELSCDLIKNEDGQEINTKIGHGIGYFSCTKKGFLEIIANFSVLVKTHNSDYALSLLRNILGDEFFNMVSNYYYSDILGIEDSFVKRVC